MDEDNNHTPEPQPTIPNPGLEYEAPRDQSHHDPQLDHETPHDQPPRKPGLEYDAPRRKQNLDIQPNPHDHNHDNTR